jgi:hypothetical protein
MDRAGILRAVISDLADLDLRPSIVSNGGRGHTTVAPSEDPKPVRAVYDLAAGTGGMLVGDRRPGTPSAGDRRSGVCVDRGGEPVARHVRLLLGAAARDPAENAEPLAARVRSHGAVGRRLSRERVERMTAHHH